MENESVMILKDDDSDLLNGFKKRYDGVHPLMFLRSLERSKSSLSFLSFIFIFFL